MKALLSGAFAAVACTGLAQLVPLDTFARAPQQGQAGYAHNESATLAADSGSFTLRLMGDNAVSGGRTARQLALAGVDAASSFSVGFHPVRLNQIRTSFDYRAVIGGAPSHLPNWVVWTRTYLFEYQETNGQLGYQWDEPRIANLFFDQWVSAPQTGSAVVDAASVMTSAPGIILGSFQNYVFITETSIRMYDFDHDLGGAEGTPILTLEHGGAWSPGFGGSSLYVKHETLPEPSLLVMASLAGLGFARRRR